MELFEKNNILKIKTIKTPEGNEVSFCPERGGIITSLKLNGQEILYLDQDTFKDINVNVKGGIPILFPNAGPIPDNMKTEALKNLKQHGFVRNSKFNSIKKINVFNESLSSDLKTKEVYPYDFKLSIDGHFEKDNSFSIIQTVENIGENEMPISSGFHPYFKVSSEEKKNIKFNFKGGDYIKDQFEKWSNNEYVSIENPNEPIEIVIPNLGVILLNFSKEYKRIWVWSMEGKDFICVEPVMQDVGGIITDPEKIKPNSTHFSSINILLKNS